MSTIKVVGLQSASGINFSIQRNKLYEFESSLALSLIRDGICKHLQLPEPVIPAPVITINDAKPAQQVKPVVKKAPAVSAKVVPKKKK